MTSPACCGRSMAETIHAGGRSPPKRGATSLHRAPFSRLIRLCGLRADAAWVWMEMCKERKRRPRHTQMNKHTHTHDDSGHKQTHKRQQIRACTHRHRAGGDKDAEWTKETRGEPRSCKSRRSGFNKTAKLSPVPLCA